MGGVVSKSKNKSKLKAKDQEKASTQQISTSDSNKATQSLSLKIFEPHQMHELWFLLSNAPIFMNNEVPKEIFHLIFILLSRSSPFVPRLYPSFLKIVEREEKFLSSDYTALRIFRNNPFDFKPTHRELIHILVFGYIEGDSLQKQIELKGDHYNITKDYVNLIGGPFGLMVHYYYQKLPNDELQFTISCDSRMGGSSLSVFTEKETNTQSYSY